MTDKKTEKQLLYEVLRNQRMILYWLRNNSSNNILRDTMQDRMNNIERLLVEEGERY